MTKNQAIRALQSQIEKLDKPENNDRNWLIQTISLLQTFFGENSIEAYNSEKQMGSGNDAQSIKCNREYLTLCCETIKMKGLPNNYNFLHTINTMSNTKVVSILVVFANVIFWSGYFIGNNAFNIRSIQKELEAKKDSLSFIKQYNFYQVKKDTMSATGVKQ